MNRMFVYYYYFVGWSCISLGIHVDLSLPNFELHVPFGFFRIGYVFNDIRDEPPDNLTEEEKRIWCRKRTFGFDINR